MDFGLARQAPNRKMSGSLPSLATLARADTNATIEVLHQRACDVGDRLEGCSGGRFDAGHRSFEAAAWVTETGFPGRHAGYGAWNSSGQIADVQSDCPACGRALRGASGSVRSRARPCPTWPTT